MGDQQNVASGKLVNAGAPSMRKSEKDRLCVAFNKQAKKHCKIIQGNYRRFLQAARKRNGKLTYWEAKRLGLIKPRGQFLEGMMSDLPKGSGWEYDKLAGFVSQNDTAVHSLDAMSKSSDPMLVGLGVAAAAAKIAIDASLSPSKARWAMVRKLGTQVPKSGRKWVMRPLFPDIRTPSGAIGEVKGPYDSPGRNHEHYKKLDPEGKYADIDAATCKAKAMNADGTCKGGPTRDQAANTIMPWLSK